jgi:hypothetical protein
MHVISEVLLTRDGTWSYWLGGPFGEMVAWRVRWATPL